MSSKTTILLTDDFNEHFYSDCADKIEDKNGDIHDAITLEFNKKNIRIDANDSEDLVITIINPDCELYEVFRDLANKKTFVY